MKTSFVELRDLLILMGLSLIGTGLYFWFGLGQALTIPGAILTLIAVIGTEK